MVASISPSTTVSSLRPAPHCTTRATWHSSARHAATSLAQHDFLTLSNSHLIGGYSAIYADGLSNVALPTQRVITIEGNTLEGQGSKSIYLRCIPDMTVRANRILASGKAHATIRRWTSLSAKG